MRASDGKFSWKFAHGLRFFRNVLGKMCETHEDMAISLLFVNQNLRTGRPEPESYNFSNPPNTDFLTFINLKHVIYDIGTEILCKTCFGHNSTQNERKSMIFSGSCTEFYVYCESAIKTRFQALFKNRHPWIRGYRFRKSLHF